MLNLKDFIEEQSEGATDWEIDLSPLLALMVTLIPVLLLQTSFITLKMIRTSVPVLSDSTEPPPPDKKDKVEFELSLYAASNFEVTLDLFVNKRKEKSVKIKAVDGKSFDTVKIQEELLLIKKKYPKENGLKLMPDEKMLYDQVVKLIDASRTTPERKPVQFVTAKGEKFETDQLFPDVTFGNITN